MPRNVQDAAQLLQLSKLITSSIQDVIEEWGSTEESKEANRLPSWRLFQAQRVLLASVGKLTELVSEPSSRLLEVSSQYNESRCLFIAAERRIPDLLASPAAPLEPADLSKKVGIETRKLIRVLRCLTSIGIFEEIGPELFVNNRISEALVKNEPLRAYIMLFGLDLYTASDHLPQTLLHPKKGPSYDVAKTAWQDALGTELPRWDWLEQKVPLSKLQNSDGAYPGVPSIAAIANGTDEPVPRPEHEIFGLAMVGGGRVFGAAHLYDYPWDSLGMATVVDVGGGVGGFCLQLSHLYPHLSFVIQDRAPAMEQAKNSVWPAENPLALQEGRVAFTPHDFFQVNPVKGAEIYWLRYILHDWSDDYCVKILSNIRASMSPTSRLLVAEQVMTTTLHQNSSVEGEELAPAPLPANYGYHARYSHQRDLAMMAIINGIERTPYQFHELMQKAGLRIVKIWPCRSQVSLIECATIEKSANGVNGTNGVHGANGVNEVNGANGVNEVNGVNGMNGMNGHGTNGVNGVNGTNGVNGVH